MKFRIFEGVLKMKLRLLFIAV